MEVYVSNVAEQASETALSKFLKPFLVKLSIQSVHCQKSRGKRFAFLTFLHVTEGQKFMAQYGVCHSFTPFATFFIESVLLSEKKIAIKGLT